MKRSLRFSFRSRRPRHSSSGGGSSRHHPHLFVWLCVALLAWSLIPLASVGFFETRILTLALWFSAALAAFFPPSPAPGRSLVPRAIALLLLGWCALQLVPLSADRAEAIWWGDPSLLPRILEYAGGRLSIAVRPFHSFHVLLWWTALAAFAAVAVRHLRSPKARRYLLTGIVLVAVAEAVYGIFALEPGTFRVRATFANSDAFAGLLAIALPLSVGMLLDVLDRAVADNARRLRHLSPKQAVILLLWLLVSALLAVVLVFTGSRGGAIAAFSAVMLLLFLHAGSSPRRWRVALVLLLLLAALFAAFHVQALHQNLWERASGDADTLQSNVASRTEIWKAAVSLARRFPLGTGAGGTAMALPMGQNATYGAMRLDYAHNDTLQFLCDLGVPGFILFSLLIAWLCARAWRAVRRAADSRRHRWLGTAAAFAFFAALAHAQVEFNLSARPPLQLVFVLLAAVLVSASAPRRRGPPRTVGPFARTLSACFLSLLAVAAACPTVKAAAAYRLLRSAAIAIGQPAAATDSALFLPPPAPPAGIPARLETARHLAPACPWAAELSAEALLHAHRTLVEQTATATARARAAAEPDADPADGLQDIVPSPAILALAEFSLRPEEAGSLREALPHAETALRLSPWQSETIILRAKILLRGAALHAFPPDRADEALADLRLAASLYPFRASTFAAICTAIAAGDGSEANHDALLAYAAQAFSLDPSTAADGIDEWWHVGIPLSSWLALPGVPLSVIRRCYARIAPEDPIEAFRLLDIADIRTAPDVPLPPTAARWTPAAQMAWRLRLRRGAHWAATERFRLQLRLGDWPSIAASAPARAAIRRDRILLSLDELANAVPRLRLLRLRQWDAEKRLPPDWRAEWALRELENGGAPDRWWPVLEAAARLAPLAPAQLDRLRPWTDRPLPAPDAPAPVPDGSLAISYLGERLFLDGISLDPSASKNNSYRLNLRFRADVPGELPRALKASVSLRDSDNRNLLSRSAPLEPDGTDPRILSATFAFPPLASYADTLLLTLKSDAKPLRSDDDPNPLRLSFRNLPAPSE